MPVHLRLNDSSGSRYFIELQPRGTMGDVHRVPAALIDDHTFVSSVNQRIVEILTQTEVQKIDYGQVGYRSPQAVKTTRPEDTTLVTKPDWDGRSTRAPQRSIVTADQVTRSVEAPSFEQFPAELKRVTEDRRATSEDMIPDGVDIESRKVTVERVRTAK